MGMMEKEIHAKQEQVLHKEEEVLQDQEKLQEQAHELFVEQRALANRMIAHLAEFEHEKEVVNDELLELAQWKKQEEGKLRKVVKGLMLFVAFWAIGGIATGYYTWTAVQDNQTNIARINTLSTQNERLIKQVDTLNRTQADQVYKDCVSRNDRAKVSLKEFGRLERIAIKDGNLGEAKFWREYRVKISKQKLPPCEKPKNTATGDGDPVKTPVTTTTTVPRS